ncbi:MAG: hypothetical protein WCY37_01295 [Candidatus Dojkabacteria bacterium]
MTEPNTPIENSSEQNKSYWSDVRKLLDNDDPRRKNDGVVELLLKMTPELLEEDYDTYEEGFDLVLKALGFEDTERTQYYPVRVCAVCTLVNVIEHIQKNPKVEYAAIYVEAALAIEDKAYDKEEHGRVRLPAKAAVRRYLNGYRKRIFR